MTLDEACLYLGISPDDEDLDIEKVERNYRTKIAIYDPSRFNPDTPEYREARRMRADIEEAYKYLLEVYEELYAPEEPKPDNRKNEGLLLKMAVVIAAVFLVSFGGVVYFVYRLHKESVPPLVETVPSQEYERILRELEQIRSRQEEAPAPQAAITNPPADYTALVEKVMPSMLFIETDRGTGSGFFVSSNGDILTNYHVIEGAGQITATTRDGLRLNAMVKDYDSVRDMALLKVNLSYSSPFLKISTTLPKQGEAVIAVGNPRGYTGTVWNGIVSSIREFDDNLWVQFTAPISPGSSGGALVNLQGEVIGMPTKLRTDGQNLNFAVAPTVLSQFFSSAINKPARSLVRADTPRPAPLPKTPSAPRRPNPRRQLPGTKFVRSDDGYEMYLYTQGIEYDRQTHLASFITLWWPTEKSKAQMRQDPNFDIPPGMDLGVCMLVYVANLRENTYVHLRTINFCDDGETIARDYIKPSYEIKWRRPAKGSRPEALMNEVKKQLRIR